MQENRSWNLFLQSGSIRDYLQYCKEMEKEETEPGKNKPDKWVEKHAGLASGDGNGN